MMEETKFLVLVLSYPLLNLSLEVTSEFLNGVLPGFLNNVLISPEEKGKRLFKPAEHPFVISQINLN